MASALVIEKGELYDPERRGVQDLLCVQGQVVSVGKNFEVDAIRKLEIEYEVIDAEGCYVFPGLVDPHQHLIGGSGEKGFSSQTPEVILLEEIEAGVTTIVGCLGVDTYTRNLPALLAKVKAFNEEGLSAFLYSGGYEVPPVTLTGSLRTDLILIPEVIGAGEIAVSDLRASQASLSDLARVVADAYVGGILSGKSGVTHFHVGPAPSGLSPIETLLTDFDVRPQSLYPTHVHRSEGTLRSAIALSRKGVFCDLDTEEQDLALWIERIVREEGDLDQFTVSSDTSFNSPSTLFSQLETILNAKLLPLERALALFTRNPARALGLSKKGQLGRGNDADLLIVEKEGFRIREVVSKGRVMMRSGRVTHEPRALANSNRKVELYGQKKGFALR